MMTLSLMCFATAFTWQTFLLCLWCDLDMFCRFLSYAISWAVVVAVAFPQHVYQQGQFAFTIQREALPVAEPESTIGGISTAVALVFLCIWELYFALLRMRQANVWILLLRTIGVGGALFTTVVYFASYFSDEQMIFTWGTELYCLCLCWIFLILTFATTVYETYDMRIKLCIASHTTMTAATTIVPFGLTAMERAGIDAAGIDVDSNFMSVECDTSRPGESNARQRRVHKHAQNAGTSTKLCENCEGDTEATLFCDACGVHYCEACAAAVHAPRALRLHRLTLIGEPTETIEPMQLANGDRSVIAAGHRKGDNEAAGETNGLAPLSPEKVEKAN